MPRSRAGRVVRCPECKCAMRVPQLTQAQLKMGRVIPCRAKLARRRKLDQPSHRKTDLTFEAVPVESGVDSNPVKSPTEPSMEGSGNQLRKPVIPPAPSQDLLDLFDSQVPELPKPKRRSFVGLESADSDSVASTDSGISRSTPFINLDDTPFEEEQEKDWEERLSTANQDRKLFARFFAGCMILVAILNVIPAGLQWYHWAQLIESVPLPRWIYIQIFIGGVYLIYAVFLAQVPDWSALRAVSVAMLLTAFVFGIISAGLLIGGNGDFSGYLGVPFALNRQACVWCVAMLCVATLMSFWGGKESAHWQRAEQILQDIVTGV